MLMRILIMVLLSSLSHAATAQSSQSGYGQKSTQTNSQSTPQTACPWLTEGSAAKALGGDVSVTVTMSNTAEGSCKFVRRQGPLSSLEILISKTSLPSCPAGSVKLTGIGNEAAECRLSTTHGEASKMVGSRVRELHFVVTLIDHGQKTPAKSEEDDVLAQIAEQVAGNLY